jgi:hypothetical protein
MENPHPFMSSEDQDRFIAAKFGNNQIEGSGIQYLVNYYLNIFSFHNESNVLKVFFLCFLSCYIFIWLFQVFFKALPRTSEQSLFFYQGEPRKIKIIVDWLNVAFVVFCMIVLIPYSRMDYSYSWLCYWEYILVLIYNTCFIHEEFRPFLLKYCTFCVLGFSSCANIAYFYYGFFDGEMKKFFIHMLPPLWTVLLFVVNLEHYETPLFDDKLAFSFNISNFVLIIWVWRCMYTPHIVYSKPQMDHLYLMGGVVPTLINMAFVLAFYSNKRLRQIGKKMV